jgi:hypothetical protein
MMKKKPYIEDHKKIARQKLTVLKEILKARGMSPEQIQKDPKARHYRAQIRQADDRLAEIARLEAQTARKADIKAQKLAAPKTEAPKKKRRPVDPVPKRAKREKKIASMTAEAAETEA